MSAFNPTKYYTYLSIYLEHKEHITSTKQRNISFVRIFKMHNYIHWWKNELRLQIMTNVMKKKIKQTKTRKKKLAARKIINKKLNKLISDLYVITDSCVSWFSLLTCFRGVKFAFFLLFLFEYLADKNR